MSAKSFWAFVGVVAVIALLAFGVFTEGNARLEPGDAVPVTELEVLLPEEADLTVSMTGSIQGFRGQWVLLNVWASWCNPCRDEAPALQAFFEDHGGKEFTVLGIDTQDGTEDALEFVSEFRLTYPSLRDGSGDYADELGATGVPESFLIDPQGDVAVAFPGPVTAETLAEAVLPLIDRGGY